MTSGPAGPVPVVGLQRAREVLTVALQAGRHVLIEGPPGTGKSTLLRHIARQAGQKVIFVEGNAELTPARLAGQYDPAQVLAHGYVPGSLREHSEGKLWAWRSAFATEMAWAPAYKGDDLATVRAFRSKLDSAGVGVTSLLPVMRWSGPGEVERQAAVRYWKRAIAICVELGVDTMNWPLGERVRRASARKARQSSMCSITSKATIRSKLPSA